MLPSLYISAREARAWSVPRAASYGAVIGLLAGSLKILGSLHETSTPGASTAAKLTASAPEIAGAALGFALLCAGAAALRNLIARRLIWPDIR